MGYTKREIYPAILPATTIQVSIGGSNAESAAILTDKVRLAATVDCFVSFGAAPVAVAASSMYLPAKAVEYFQFISGQKISVVQSTTGGTLSVAY